MSEYSVQKNLPSSTAFATVVTHVAVFDQVCGNPNPAGVQDSLQEDTKQLRIALMREELEELIAAMHDSDAEGILDGIMDLVWVTIGTGLAYGMRQAMSVAWLEVYETNMAKVGPDGAVRRRPDGKILKPDGWVAPDMAKIIEHFR